MFEPQNFANLYNRFKKDRAETLFRICLVYGWYTGLYGPPCFSWYMFILCIRYWYTTFIWIGIYGWYTLVHGVFPFLNEFLPCDCRQKLHIAGVPLQDFRTTGWPARKINMPSEKCSSNLKPQRVLPWKPDLIFIKYPSAHVIAGLQISTQQGRCFSSQK